MRRACLMLLMTSVVAINAYSRSAADRSTVSRQGANPARVRSVIIAAIRDALGQDVEIDYRDVVILGPVDEIGSKSVTVVKVFIDERNRRAEVRLRCADGGCLPFHAFVTARGFPISNLRTKSLTSPRAPLSEKDSQPSVHLGSRIMLIISTPEMRLSVPAICLENRRVGEAVRVRALGMSRVVRAFVREPGIVVAEGAPE